MPSDPRFARLRSDPRFRRPRAQARRIQVDERFRSVLPTKQKHNKNSASVDKYGRHISGNEGSSDVNKYLRLQDNQSASAIDYARGEVLLASSDEESDSSLGNAESDVDQDFVTLGRDLPDEIDLNEDHLAELDQQAAAYRHKHPEDGTPVQQTNRLAIVNLDWDHVRAAHLYKVCSSVLSSGSAQKGTVLSVNIYASEFGKERLAREEVEGPPSELFKTSASNSAASTRDLYEVADENIHDEEALRKYQLERLRYYYAIVIFDTAEAAALVFDELEGTELERSANVFDLSFVPGEMTFDDEPWDTAIAEQQSYQAFDFVTDALRHSRVKLTWDEDNPGRIQATRKAFDQKEMEERDFHELIASSSSDEDDNENSRIPRNDMRSLLLGDNSENLPEGWSHQKNGDMEITFTPGLSASVGTGDETTLDKYQRKLREKRKRRKESKEKRAGGLAANDTFFDDSCDESQDSGSHSFVEANYSDTEVKHFDMKSIIKDERRKKRREGKGKKQLLAVTDDQKDFIINPADERFSALYDNPDFAIDPSNPHFKRTKNMTALLNERSKRHKSQTGDGELPPATDEGNLAILVEKLKHKSIKKEARSGKRRKIV